MGTFNDERTKHGSLTSFDRFEKSNENEMKEILEGGERIKCV